MTVRMDNAVRNNDDNNDDDNNSNTIQYIENLYSAAIQKCPGALTILKYIKTEIKSICDECTLEQKCLKPFLEYICVRAVLQVVR